MPRIDPRLQDAAASVNETVHDRAIQHALFLEGFKTREQRDIAAILDDSLIRTLDRLDARLARAAAQGFDRGPATTERLRQLSVIYSEIIGAAETKSYQQLRDDLFELAKDESTFQLGVIQNSVPVNLEMVAPPAERLRSLVTSQPMDGRLLRQWFRDASAKSRRDFTAVVNRSVAEGLSFQQIAREVRGTTFERIEGGVMKTFQDDVGVLVRSAVTHVSTQAKEEIFRANSDIIKGVILIETLDTRTCPQCMALDGKVFPVGEGPRPPHHLGCRGSSSVVLKSARELGIPVDEFPPGTRSSMRGQIPSDITYNQWLRGQSVEIQNEALGPKRGALFRKGNLNVTQFTTRRGRTLTLKELRAREPDIFEAAGL